MLHASAGVGTLNQNLVTNMVSLVPNATVQTGTAIGQVQSTQNGIMVPGTSMSGTTMPLRMNQDFSSLSGHTNQIMMHHNSASSSAGGGNDMERDMITHMGMNIGAYLSHGANATNNHEASNTGQQQQQQQQVLDELGSIAARDAWSDT